MSTKQSHRRKLEREEQVSSALLVIPAIVLGLIVTVLIASYFLYK